MTLDLFFTTTPTRSAVISDCGRYRYRLDRVVDAENPTRICWVMLNPSTADASEDDPTLRKIIGYTRRWGYGALTAVNLFAWRAIDPKSLPADLSVAAGPEADRHIREALSGSSFVVCGWGNSLSRARRAERVCQVIGLIRDAGRQPFALSLTNDGAPMHPLYLRGDLRPSAVVEAG